MKKSTTTNRASAAKGKAKISRPAEGDQHQRQPAKGDHQQKQPAKGGGAGQRGEDVQKSNDEHIDQDFPGYPHHPSHSRTIHNGSAGAFDATEHSHDDDEDQDNDDFAMDR